MRYIQNGLDKPPHKKVEYNDKKLCLLGQAFTTPPDTSAPRLAISAVFSAFRRAQAGETSAGLLEAYAGFLAQRSPPAEKTSAGFLVASAHHGLVLDGPDQRCPVSRLAASDSVPEVSAFPIMGAT